MLTCLRIPGARAALAAKPRARIVLGLQGSLRELKRQWLEIKVPANSKCRAHHQQGLALRCSTCLSPNGSSVPCCMHVLMAQWRSCHSIPSLPLYMQQLFSLLRSLLQKGQQQRLQASHFPVATGSDNQASRNACSCSCQGPGTCTHFCRAAGPADAWQTLLFPGSCLEKNRSHQKPYGTNA